MARRLAISLLALATLALSPSSACQTDDDCSLNGVCTRGRGDSSPSSSSSSSSSSTCACDPGWLGADCSALDVRPARPGSGYNRTEAGVSSWGSKIVRDPLDRGLHHLFAAEFTHDCGLDYWSPYSRVVRAESRTGPQGPYTFAAQVVGHFAHNPTVVWSPADREYLMYYIGCAQPVNATACTGPSFTCGPGNYINGESGISVATSRDLRRWTLQGQVLRGDDGPNWDADVTNPSPFPLYGGGGDDDDGDCGASGPGGSRSDAMLLVYRGCPVNCTADFERINVASSATGWRGPYRKLSPRALFPESNEDPFVWRDRRGHWHMLLHSLEADGGFGAGPKVGRHAFARRWEGPWTFVNETLAFDTTVRYEDGRVVRFYRRERPQLFFSDDGLMRPLYLTTGVQEQGSAMSYSVVVPVGDEPK